jgi:hypothetical protein
MVKNNESKVKITTRNIKYYTDRNYICKIGDIISIDINTMPKNSHNKVIAICEVCSVENEIQFSKYNKNKNNQGYYCCHKCSGDKFKKTMFNKYGVEFGGQLDFVRESNKKWMSSEEFKDKSKIKIKKIYDVGHYSKTDKFKKDMSLKIKEIVKLKKEEGIYDCPFLWKNNRELREKGMIDKYGATYSFQIPEIKKKIQDKNLEKFGHVSPFGNDEIKIKLKDKIIYKNENDITVYLSNIYSKKEFNVYRRKIKYKTDIVRKQLFENWNGYDFYDGEYIKDNLDLHWNNKNYPTIDHKISCFFGYINNIPVDEISNISNLCITKRFINVEKGHLSNDEFLTKFNFLI